MPGQFAQMGAIYVRSVQLWTVTDDVPATLLTHVELEHWVGGLQRLHDSDEDAVLWLELVVK